MEIKLLFGRAVRRPGIVFHPLIGPRFEDPSLGEGLGFSFALEMEDEERQLDLIAEIFTGLRSEIEIAEA